MRNINEGTSLNTFKLQKVDSRIVTIEYRKKPQLTIQTANSNGSLNTMDTKSTLFYAEAAVTDSKQQSPLTSMLGNADSMKYIDFPFNFIKESTSGSKIQSPKSKSVFKAQKIHLFENSISKRLVL